MNLNDYGLHKEYYGTFPQVGDTPTQSTIMIINNRKEVKKTMGNNGDKVSITFCPFQTQISGPVKMDPHSQIVLGPPSPSIIKVACDREKCQLWNRIDNACAVSVIVQELNEISSGIGCLESSISDIVDNMPEFVPTLDISDENKTKP